MRKTITIPCRDLDKIKLITQTHSTKNMTNKDLGGDETYSVFAIYPIEEAAVKSEKTDISLGEQGGIKLGATNTTNT